MEFAFVLEDGSLIFLEEGVEIPEVGSVFESPDKETLPGLYLVEFLESYMFRDLVEVDGSVVDFFEEDNAAFIGISIKDISEMPISTLRNIGSKAEMLLWEKAYDEISEVLEDYEYEEYGGYDDDEDEW